MPTVRSYIRIDAHDLLGRAVAHAREENPIPHRIHLDEIVVLQAAQPHRDPATLIRLAADCIEAKADLRVLEWYRLVDCERKTFPGRRCARLFDRKAGCSGGVTNCRPMPLRQIESTQRRSSALRCKVEAGCGVKAGCAQFQARGTRSNQQHPRNAWTSRCRVASLRHHQAPTARAGQLCVSACRERHHVNSASYMTMPCLSISWSSGKLAERPREIANRRPD